MAYEPLHHKYRPQTFAELVGQEAIAATLTNALRQQRIAPAYLFTGARGTGKTSSARILAKSLNCLSSPVPTETPCGTCEVCRAIAIGSALDVIEIDAASNTGVDNIRELIERAQFAPVQCRYKVYVVDECHMLSTAAFNALLKTLEEPPEHVVFVLATTDPQRVLPTIISRCQRFDFRRIPLEPMANHLAAIAQQEAIDITAEAVQLVAQLSQGGLRDAESLLDQLSLLAGPVTVERVWDLVGAVPEQDLLTLVQAIAHDQATTVLDQARRLMERGREPLMVLHNLASFYRDLLIAKTSPQRQDLVAITPPTWASLCEFAASLDIRTILLGQQHLRASEAQVKNTTQPRLWLEVTLMGLLPSALAAATQPASNGSLRAQPVSQTATGPVGNGSSAAAPLPLPTPLAAGEPPAPPPAPANQPAAPENDAILADPEVEHAEVEPETTAADQPADADAPIAPPQTEVTAAAQLNLSQIWEHVLTLVQPFSTQIMLRQQCLLLGFNDQEARIGARSEKLFRMAKERLPNIETAFEKYCQHPVSVSLEIASSAPQIQTATAAPATSPSAAAPAPASRPIAREAPAAFQHSPQAQETTQPIADPAKPSGADPSIQPAASGTEPLAGAAAPAWQEEDEVSRAAKSLAQMFNGQVVSWDEQPGLKPAAAETAGLAQPSSLDGPEAGPDTESDDDDDDVPF